MHYYKRNIGDYHRKAGRLSMLQHGAYTLLLDACYDRQRFPTKEEAIEWCWASTSDEIEAVNFLLSRFFTCENGYYIQGRVLEELTKFKKNAKTNERIAREREENRRRKKGVNNDSLNTSTPPVHEPCESNNEPYSNREPSVNEAPPNHKPLTINHNNIISTKKNRAAIDYNAVFEIYNRCLTKTANVHKLTDSRKRLVKKFFNEWDMNIERLEKYLSFIDSDPESQWMFESRPKGNGQFWQPKKFEYYFSDSCYLNIKERIKK